MASNIDCKQVNTQKQTEFDELSNEKKIERGLQITRLLIDSEKKIDLEIEEISDDVQSFTLRSVEVSPFPTKSRRVMRFVLTEQLEKFAESKHFVNVNKYSIIFSDIEDLSYHNFENILNLDHLFNEVEFQMRKKKTLSSKVKKYSLEGSVEQLLSLDKLNYYTVPLNNSQRGGKRLIFHSNQLSYSLTKMIEQSHFFDKKNFSHVNNVFRLNKFAPGDKKFKSHYDTPYADHQNNLYSKYTMLIYLTGNEIINKECPPLKIEDIVVNKIKENDCIIFDQSLEHEGNAYVDHNKIFIRTELIYKIEDMEYDEEIADLFNMACYMTKEPQMQQYSADLFNSCVKMRYRGEQDEIERVYLLKKNLEVLYVTDGNQYWFPKHIDLQTAALLILLDYFNGKIYNVQNVKILSKPLLIKDSKSKTGEQLDEEIFHDIQLSSFQEEKIDKSKITQFSKISDFVPDDLCENFTVFKCTCPLGDEDDEPIKAQEYFYRKKSTAEGDLNEILNGSSVLIFDNIIKINYKNIKIQRDCDESNNLPTGKIHLSDFFINTENKINFASCQCENIYSEEDIVFFKTKKLHTFQLPDITFQVLKDGIKLSIDIFNNGFIHQATETFQQPYTNKSKSKQKNKSRYNYRRYRNDDESEKSDNSDDEDSASSSSEEEEEKDEQEEDANPNNKEENGQKDANHDENHQIQDDKDFSQEGNNSKSKIALQSSQKTEDSSLQKMNKLSQSNKKKAEEDEDLSPKNNQARLKTESK